MPVSSEDSLPFAMRSVCWEHDLGWALDAPTTSIGTAVIGSRGCCWFSVLESFEVHPPSGSADECGILFEDMIAEVVPESRTEVHSASAVVWSPVRGGHDLESEPRGGVIDADVIGSGLGVPCAEEVVFVAADEGRIPGAHERLGGGGPRFAVEGRTAAVVVVGTRWHSGAGADHPPMISVHRQRQIACEDGVMTSLFLSGDPKADALLAEDRFALLVGMLLDQQVTMESAFAGPAKLAERLGKLDVDEIAEMNPDDFLDIFAQTPAVHRFPKSMAGRVQKLAATIVDEYDGNVEAIWSDGNPSGAEVLKRLKKLPGFGDQKAKIFLALLGKQFELQAEGWQEAAGDYGDPEARRSIADVVDDVTLQEVRAFKKQQKAAAKAAKAANK